MAQTKQEMEALLAPFLGDHPYSTIDEITAPTSADTEASWFFIDKPWNDDTLLLSLMRDSDRQTKLIEALNSVILSSRFSAIWHKDTKDLEVVWTAFKLSAGAQDIADRKFTFKFGGRSYDCEFGDGSARLLALADAAIWLRGSDTGWRNLVSIEAYVAQHPEMKERLDKPRCFWVRNVEWDEDAVVDLAYHLNFYMSYFDDKTAKIIIHPTPQVSAVKAQHRYVAGKFPATIAAKSIDPNILHFWNAAHGADDQAKSFLYYYRLIEYASTSYVDGSARAALRRLLAQPNLLDDIEGAAEQLVLATQVTAKEEEQKIVHMLRDTLDKAAMWRELENNSGAFTKETKFEGGFTLEPLLPQNAKSELFEIAKFTKHIKDIRNALSHGRDIRTQMVIVPIQRNFDLLQPWVTLMCIAAGQVILYRSVI